MVAYTHAIETLLGEFGASSKSGDDENRPKVLRMKDKVTEPLVS